MSYVCLHGVLRQTIYLSCYYNIACGLVDLLSTQRAIQSKGRLRQTVLLPIMCVVREGVRGVVSVRSIPPRFHKEVAARHPVTNYDLYCLRSIKKECIKIIIKRL